MRLFEKLCLEGFQSGLSWLTILRKREGFRRAFAGFDFRAVAGFGPADVERLLGDASIVRHRGKIESTINNAAPLCRARRGARLARRVRVGFRAGSGGATATGSRGMCCAAWRRRPESQALAKDLKRRGWRFVGPTTVYAFMQAMGLVNDHLDGCDVRARGGAGTREIFGAHG